MEDAETIKQMILVAINECDDIDLLDLVYKLLAYETYNGGESPPPFLLCKYCAPRNGTAYAIRFEFVFRLEILNCFLRCRAVTTIN